LSTSTAALAYDRVGLVRTSYLGQREFTASLTADPLADAGDKDITAHVNFTGIALAGQDAGLDVLGYTSQARFLLNNGIAETMTRADVRERAAAQKLVAEHEMGELFKVLGFAKGCTFDAIGFATGDRSHRL